VKRKNRHYKRAKISERKFREILHLFAMDLPATKTAEITCISVRSINTIYQKIRSRLTQECALHSPFEGEIEVDESYFGPRRVRGKRGRGAGSKTIVFGIFKRNGLVYTEIVPNARKSTLQKVIRGNVSVDSIIHSDGWRGYHGLVDVGYAKHFRVHHGDNEFVRGSSHINGIESFWAYAKLRLAKLKGIPAHTFELHLKETEFRFNHRHDNLYKLLLRTFRNKPL